MCQKLVRIAGRSFLKRQKLAIAIASLLTAQSSANDLRASTPLHQLITQRTYQAESNTPPAIATPAPTEVRRVVPTQRAMGSLPPANGDSFLGPDDSPSTPSISDDAASLYDASTQPTPSPFAEPGTLDAPTFNLATGLAASSLGTTRGSQSAAPAMFGDFFGGSFLFGSEEGAVVALAGGDRLFKISENVSPMPQDRIFFNYNHFHNALTDVRGNDYSLDRFTFGAEKTFSDSLFSLESRLPFSSALNSTVDFDNIVPQATELGNLAFALKVKLFETRRWLVSAGSTMTLPTGDDYIQKSSGVETLRVANDSVHLAPFIGMLARPDDNWFFQGFVQTDFDTQGNRVFDTGQLQGRLQDQNLLFVDLSYGRWLKRSSSLSRRSIGVAALSELHYTTTMNQTDSVFGLGNPDGHVDILNATLGLQFQYGMSALRVGAGAPLRDNEEKLFDSEILVQASRLF